VQTHYVTGTAAPCTSIFKPVWLGADLPDTGPEPTGTYEDRTLFWRHEGLHRATLRNYPALIPLYAADRDALEARFIAGAAACRDASPIARSQYAAECFVEASAAEQAWLERVRSSNVPDRQNPLYKSVWAKHNRAAQMP
jgi:hypothetical protein